MKEIELIRELNKTRKLARQAVAMAATSVSRMIQVHIKKNDFKCVAFGLVFTEHTKPELDKKGKPTGKSIPSGVIDAFIFTSQYGRGFDPRFGIKKLDRGELRLNDSDTWYDRWEPIDILEDDDPRLEAILRSADFISDGEDAEEPDGLSAKTAEPANATRGPRSAAVAGFGQEPAGPSSLSPPPPPSKG